ncbi:MAG: hypothetical protein AAGA18_00755 [Verrucomicrobiota bacterium]
MIIWSTSKAVALFKEDTINDRLVLPYFITYSLLVALGTYMTYEVTTIWGWLEVGLDVIAVVFGTLYLYRLNNGANGNQFLNKYFIIGLPVALRAILIFIVIAVPTYLIAQSLDIDTESGNPIDFILLLIFYILFYWYFGLNIKKTLQNKVVD